MPPPTDVQDDPSQRARSRVLATPPTEAKLPPAIRPPSGMTVSARTEKPLVSSTPPPKDDHTWPSHRAILFRATAPVEVKYPPAIKSPFGMTANALTPFSPSPSPSGAHA